MRKARAKIYQSRLHLAVTLFFVALPFLFLLLFSRVAHIATSRLFTDVFISFWRLLVAFVISVVLAWIWAVLFYRGKRSTVALPFFDVLQSFPTFAVLPLATLVWGASNFTVISFLVVTVVWPIFFSIVSALKLMKHDWAEAVEIFGLKGFNRLRYFLLPVSISGLITGSIIGLGEGWEALVATEMIAGVKKGLGGFFQFFVGSPAITAFGILGVLILIFSLNKLVWLQLLEWSHRRMEE